MPGFVTEFNITSLRPMVVEPFWFTSDNRVVKSLIILYYAILVAIPLGTAAIGLLLNLFLDILNTILPIGNSNKRDAIQITITIVASTKTWDIVELVSIHGFISQIRMKTTTITIDVNNPINIARLMKYWST